MREYILSCQWAYIYSVFVHRTQLITLFELYWKELNFWQFSSELTTNHLGPFKGGLLPSTGGQYASHCNGLFLLKYLFTGYLTVHRIFFLINGSFSFADRRLIEANRIFLECMCGNIPLYRSNFLTTILLSEKKYTNNNIMIEWKKRSGQIGKMQMTLCNSKFPHRQLKPKYAAKRWGRT